MSTRTPWIVRDGIGSPPFHSWPYGYYLWSSHLYATQNSQTRNPLYLFGTHVIHSNLYYWNHSSKPSNSDILVAVNLRFGYSTLLILPPWKWNNPLLNVSCIPGYPHHSMMRTESVVSASGGACLSIGVASSFSETWASSELSSAKLDSAYHFLSFFFIRCLSLLCNFLCCGYL